MNHAQNALRDELIRSLQNIYQLKAFGTLAELLQGEALVLHFLATHRGEVVYPSVLSDQLHLSRSRITGTMNSLRHKEYIEMEPSQRDRRRMQVAITERGIAQIGHQQAEMLTYFDRMIEGLGEGDAQTLIALMDHCADIMKA